MMIDYDKVNNGLQNCAQERQTCFSCPYYTKCLNEVTLSVELVEDIRRLIHEQRDEIERLNSMLKEREAVKPLAQADDTFECSCGAIVGWEELDSSGIVEARLNYCPFCGREVKWE